jgi:Na+-transporting NADH:ubiquinone oxidoreductase subunit F
MCGLNRRRSGSGKGLDMSLTDPPTGVKVWLEGRAPIAAPPSRTLLALLRSGQVLVPFACGGHGSCGLCKVRIRGEANPATPAEERLLRQSEREAGARLACQVRPCGDLHVDLPPAVLAAREFRATLRAVEPRTPDIRGFLLDLPPDSGLAFAAGQFILLRIPPYPGSRLVLQRPYSMASPPSQATRLELNIRRAPGGAATTYLFDHLKPGDPVVFFGPYGDFRLLDSNRPMVFLAGGSGLSPIKAMLEHLAETGSQRPAIFFFGARTEADLFHLEAMRELGRRLPNFRFVPALSEPASAGAWTGERGLVTDVAERLIPWNLDFEAYLCGSPGMIAAALAMLRRRHVPEERILYDQFN